MNTVLILIIGLPLIEIYLFIKIGSQIGAFNTVLLILLTAVVGVAYARYEGFNTLKSGMRQLIKNELHTNAREYLKSRSITKEQVKK